MTRFTRNEIELIQHRLDVPDAIADVLRDGEPTLELSNDEVESACRIVSDRIRNFTVEMLVSPSLAAPLILAVFRDAVEGSTYVACAATEAEFEDKPHVLRAARKALEGIASKCEAAGFPIDTSSAYV